MIGVKIVIIPIVLQKGVFTVYTTQQKFYFEKLRDVLERRIPKMFKGNRQESKSELP